MGRTAERKPGPTKGRVNATPDKELLAWVKARTGPGKEFSSVTHAIERGWLILKEIEEGKWVRAKGK